MRAYSAEFKPASRGAQNLLHDFDINVLEGTAKIAAWEVKVLYRTLNRTWMSDVAKLRRRKELKAFVLVLVTDKWRSYFKYINARIWVW